jgi:hypothetical protein
MKMIKIRKFPVLLILVVLVGCIPAPKYITQKNSAYSASEYSLSMPEGWVAYQDTNGVGITRDGRLLQWIYVGKNPVKEYFKDDYKKINNNILPSELADLYIAKFKKENESSGVEIISNEFSNISGKPGFKVSMKYKNEKGLSFSQAVYGVIDTGDFFQLSYSATDIMHFEKFKPDFESAVSSFKFK